MQIVPLQASPNQNVNVTLAAQPVMLHIYQLDAGGLFVDLYVNSSLIIGGVIAENLNRIVRNAYLGFIGDFMFLDQQGTDDPVWTGLGSRWVLVYLEAADVVGLE